MIFFACCNSTELKLSVCDPLLAYYFFNVCKHVFSSFTIHAFIKTNEWHYLNRNPPDVRVTIEQKLCTKNIIISKFKWNNWKYWLPWNWTWNFTWVCTISLNFVFLSSYGKLILAVFQAMAFINQCFVVFLSNGREPNTCMTCK